MTRQFRVLAHLAAIASSALLCAAPGKADVTINLFETPTGVSASSAGSIDLTGLSFLGAGTTGPSELNPAGGSITTGSEPGSYVLYAFTANPAPNFIFGSGGLTPATSTTGSDPLSFFGLDINDSLNFQIIYFSLPYVSGSALPTSQSEWAGSTFSSLGITPGTYVVTLPSNSKITLNATASPVAEVPGPLPILGLGAALSWSRSLRKRIKRSKQASLISA